MQVESTRVRAPTLAGEYHTSRFSVSLNQHEEPGRLQFHVQLYSSVDSIPNIWKFGQSYPILLRRGGSLLHDISNLFSQTGNWKSQSWVKKPRAIQKTKVRDAYYTG
jgi:hypothetical protein